MIQMTFQVENLNEKNGAEFAEMNFVKCQLIQLISDLEFNYDNLLNIY